MLIWSRPNPLPVLTPHQTEIGVPPSLRDEYVSPDDIRLDDQVQLQYRIT